MKRKKILSVSIAAAWLLTSVSSPVMAVENIQTEETTEAIVGQIYSGIQESEAALKSFTDYELRASETTPTTAEAYTLTVDDVKVIQCREDDGNSNSPLIDALWIIGLQDGVDFTDAKYKNIVIPETLPFDKPVLDDEGNVKKDDDGNVITETVEMPVIKFGLNVTERDNLEKITFSKNLRVLTENLANYKNLSEVVIPDGSELEAFTSGAFKGTSISSIYIPADVTSIPDELFVNCKYLTKVTFSPESKLKSIGAHAFSGTSLKSIDIPDTVTSIGQCAFGMNYAPGGESTCLFEEIVLPDGLEEISDYLFWGCSKLRNVTFGSGLKTIGEDAFHGTDIEELVIPDTVTWVGPRAFNECHSLRSVKIGSGVKELGGCSWLKDKDCLSRFQQDENIETVVFSEGLEKIGDNMFCDSGKIQKIVIPSTVKNIGNFAFGSKDTTVFHSLSELTFAEDSQLENIFESAFKCCSIKHLKLPVAKKPFKIWDSAFEVNADLRDVDLGNCKEIGSATFYSNEQHYLENGAGGGAFQWCKNLKSVNIEEDEALEIINHASFNACNKLMGPITFPSGLKKIGHSAFANCEALGDITFNEGLETIGNMGFIGCNLTEIILPDTVTEVGSRCFEGNYGVEKLKISKGMTVIPFRFLDCYPADVVAFGQADAGVHCELKELVIPDNIKEIGEMAFEGCLDLETIDFGKVEIIRRGAFCLADGLTTKSGKNGSLKSIKMSPCLKEFGTVKNISEYEVGAVFEGHGYFEGLELPSTIETVYDWAFYNCPSIKEFTMTENLKFVGSHAFDGCVNLKNVKFYEDGEINTKFEDCIFENCTGLKSIVLPAGLETVPVRMFSGCSNLSDVTWNEGIETIGGGAFAYTALTSVELPESCQYIDEAAFQSAPVTNVKFGTKTLNIGDNAFIRDTHNDLMTSVYIPESVKKIGTKAFGWYKDSDKGYAEIAKEAESLGCNVSELLGPDVANNDFILYGGEAAKKYAEQNDMIYNGTNEEEKITTVSGNSSGTGTNTVTTTTAAAGSSDPASSSTAAVTTTTAGNSSSEETTVLGDANGDNKLDVLDCTYIARLLAQRKSIMLTEASDFNKDGKVNIMDAMEIAKYLAKKRNKK